MKRSEAEKIIDRRTTMCAEIREVLELFESASMEDWVSMAGVRIQLDLAAIRLQECVPIVEHKMASDVVPIHIEEDDEEEFDDLEGLF